MPIRPIPILTLLVAAMLCVTNGPERSRRVREDLAKLTAAGERLRPLHARKRPPAAGEWLAEHPEPGQTFAQYRFEFPNRPTADRTTLYVQPIGPFEGRRKDLLDLTTEALARFYGLPVKVLPAINLDLLPEAAHRNNPHTGDPQVDSLAILDLLRGRRPADAVAVLALTATDLWPNEKGRAWNFVFGQAALRDRVGVWSIARLGNPDRKFPLSLRRTLKVAIHETGHMFGILHCTAYECGMNGSNHLEECDGQPLPFCPDCEMKLWWNLKLDPAKRFGPLAEFAEAHGLDAEAKAWRAAGRAVLTK